MPSVQVVYGQGPVMADIRALLGELERRIHSCTIEVGESKFFKVFWVPSGHHRNSYAHHHLDISFYGRAVGLLIQHRGIEGSLQSVNRADYNALWVLQRRQPPSIPKTSCNSSKN